MTEKIIPIIEDREILIEDDTQESPSENKKTKKSVAEKKNEKRIMRLAGKAIAEFGMIEGGDKVMVCMSGGKDSYVLLDVLMKLQKRAPVPFELIAVNVDQHLPNFPKDVIPNYLKKIGVPYHIEDQDTWSIVQRVIPEGRNVCSVCSRLRRGIIYRVAKELGVSGCQGIGRDEDCSRSSYGRHRQHFAFKHVLRRQTQRHAAYSPKRRRTKCHHQTTGLCS